MSDAKFGPFVPAEVLNGDYTRGELNLLVGTVVSADEDDIERIVLRFSDGRIVLLSGVWHNDSSAGIGITDGKKDPIGRSYEANPAGGKE